MNKESDFMELSQANTTSANISPLRLTLKRLATRRYLLFVILVAPAFLLRIATAAYPIFADHLHGIYQPDYSG